MKLISKDPKKFHELLTKVGDDESVILRLGPKGLMAATKANAPDPEGIAREDKVLRTSLLVLVRVVGALLSGRDVQLSPSRKSWRVLISRPPAK